MINVRVQLRSVVTVVLAAIISAVFAGFAFASPDIAEARPYSSADKKIEEAIAKGRTWVDLDSAVVSCSEAYKAFDRVKRKKASYIVKAKAAQAWRMSDSSKAYGMKISYRNANQRKALNAQVKAMMKKVASWDSQSEKVEKIHDAIVKRCRYDFDSYYSGKLREDSGTAYGSLVRGRSVCAGYAEAFQLVALKAGLQVRYVRNGNHAWNLVKVGGKWYHIDACWDDTGGDKRGYFLKGSESMSEVADHAIEDCYPSKVTVAKKDYVERMPPVEVIDDDDADEAADAGNGDRTAEAATREIPTPSLGTGYAPGASSSASLKDPSADPAATGNALSAGGVGGAYR